MVGNDICISGGNQGIWKVQSPVKVQSRKIETVIERGGGLLPMLCDMHWRFSGVYGGS